MSSEGFSTEPRKAEAVGGEGDRGDWLKKRWGDKFYYRRRLKKAKVNKIFELVSGDGNKEINGVLYAAAHNEDLPLISVNLDKEGIYGQQRNKSADCIQSGNVECPQGEIFSVDKVMCKVRFMLLGKSKEESIELKGKWENELQMIRGVMSKVGVEGETFLHSVGIRSEFGSSLLVMPGASGFRQRLDSMKPLNLLSVAGMGSNFVMTEMIEKGTRSRSDFLLASDKVPSLESNITVKKNYGSAFEFGFVSKTFKRCSALLERIMTHQFSFIFDKPVDAKGLGLDDYFTIIKQPMDLGTVRERLNSNYYKVPREFAGDVRLTFHNAMTYNPEGHEVHIIAKMLMNIFDQRWDAIEMEYLRAVKLAYNNEVNTPTSTRSTALVPSLISPFGGRSFNRSMEIISPNGKIRALKKPKARDLNKRDMTYVEKQKLSLQLQDLPIENIDGIVQIIKRRYPLATHQRKEIEVDIDAIDAETLWEIDRFITNQRKSLSKMRHEDEFASQFGMEANAVVPQNIVKMELAHFEDTGAVGEGRSAQTGTDGEIMMSSFVGPLPSIAEDSKPSNSSSSRRGSGSEGSREGSKARQTASP